MCLVAEIRRFDEEVVERAKLGLACVYEYIPESSRVHESFSTRLIAPKNI